MRHVASTGLHAHRELREQRSDADATGRDPDRRLLDPHVLGDMLLHGDERGVSPVPIHAKVPDVSM